MLRLINDINKESGSHPLNVEQDKWFVTYKSDGMDTLQFEIQANDASYRYVHEEADIIVEDVYKRQLPCLPAEQWRQRKTPGRISKILQILWTLW